MFKLWWHFVIFFNFYTCRAIIFIPSFTCKNTKNHHHTKINFPHYFPSAGVVLCMLVVRQAKIASCLFRASVFNQIEIN